MKKTLFILITVIMLVAIVQSQYAGESMSNTSVEESVLAEDMAIRERNIYDIYSDSILTLIHSEKHRTALTVAREMYQKALKSQDDYGLFCSYRALARIQLERGDTAQMVHNANTALMYAAKCNPQPSVTNLYHLLYKQAFNYYKKDHTSDTHILEEALKGARTDEDRFRANIYLAYDYARRDLWDGYFKYFKQAQKYHTPEYEQRMESMYHKAVSYQYIYKNDYEGAIKERQQIPDALERFNSIYNIVRYKEPKRLDIAVEYADSIDSINTVNQLRNDNGVMIEFEGQLENSLLRQQAEEQSAKLLAAQLEASRQASRQSELEQENLKRTLEGKRLEQEQQAKEAELKLSEAQIKNRKTELAQKEQKMREQRLYEEHESNTRQTTLLIAIIISLALLFSILIWWVFRYRSLVRRIKSLNAEESNLHEVAVKASEQKNDFIRNMSHEVRTPLNNVSGFAQLLAQPEGMLTDEERAEYGQLISEDSIRLTEYINSILDSSRREYTKKHKNALVLLPIAFIISLSLSFFAVNSANGDTAKGSAGLSAGEQTSSSSDEYFDSMYNKARELLYNHHSLSALQIARQLNHRAHVEGNVAQRFDLYKLFADIYIRRNSKDDVVPNYLKALEANKLLGNPENPYSIYLGLFDHASKFKYSEKERLSFLDSALVYDPTDVSRASTLIRYANYYGAKGDTAMFYHYYAKFDSVSKIQHNMRKSSYDPVRGHVKKSRLATSQVYIDIFHNDHEAALAAIEKLYKKEEKYKMYYDYYRNTGQYLKALAYRDSLNNENQRLRAEYDAIDRQDLNTMLGNDSIAYVISSRKVEEGRLQLARQQLLLRQQQLEMERQRQDAENRRLEMDGKMKENKLQLNKSQMQQRQAELKRKEIAMRNEAMDVRQREMVLTNNMLMTVIFILGLATVIVIAFLIIRRRKMKQIQILTKNLRGARYDAVNATKMKDLFIQNMSHEIRTPLNAITGFSQLLSLPYGTFPQEETQQFATYIHHNIRLLTMLIDDILNIGKIERGDYEMIFDDCSVNETVRMAMTTVEYRVPMDVVMSFSSDVDDSLMINTDDQRMQQIIINFLTNACKHTQEGTIKVHVARKDDKIEISVADTGEGIPQEQAENIFQRFVKLDSFVQGTGLGLNICRILSEKLGGRVWLDTSYPYIYNNVEHGARFVLELPVSRL